MKKLQIPKDMLMNQLEEALEERQRPDRRKGPHDRSLDIQKDRRQQDRRSSKKH